MKIIDVVELNENGVEIGKSDRPTVTRYFDDNGSLADGNFDENNIAGWWILIDGEVDVSADVTYAYRTIDDTALIKHDELKFDFDEELANKYDLNNDYSHITVDVEKYEDYFEIGAGFWREEGSCTEIFLEPEDLFGLLQK